MKIKNNYIRWKRVGTLLTVLGIYGTISLSSCKPGPGFDVDHQLNYCLGQLSKSVSQLPDSGKIPRNILPGQKEWNYVGYRDWCSGFWPGILWYAYDYTRDRKWLQTADRYSRLLFPLADRSPEGHDLGFELYCSLGNGYRLTDSTDYKAVLLRAADSLATLYNSKVGTILSWPHKVKGTDWPLRHNTIMDNMMNLELLFWASKNGGAKRLYDIAVSHALKTMKNQFRPDYSSYHVVLYDTATGEKVKAITHQGYADNSMWARGQAWAIYGYTMTYRETKDPQFLDFARKVTDVYLKRLPEDLIPYWDFDDPSIPDAPRDASAAAITASALLELSGYVMDKTVAEKYYDKAVAMLKELSSVRYQSRNVNNAFLLHSTGNMPEGSEINASIIYADYYYMEALIRLHKLQNKENLL
ncbi:glycoside hydrolase family 88 protein [Arachidicoccus terrestris]|nr:glycoside hydrolase family 88 protein [Arachidicoccus terrestris]